MTEDHPILYVLQALSPLGNPVYGLATDEQVAQYPIVREAIERAERAEAERDATTIGQTSALNQRDAARAEAATWKERCERARGKLLALFCKDDNCPTRLRSEDSPYVCDGCPVGAALADDPPKGGTP